MKTSLLVCIASLATISAQAQVFRPETVNGAIVGGIAGAVIGNNSGNHNGAKGALVGGVAGALVGSAVADSRHDRGYRSSSSVRVGIGVGSSHHWGRHGYYSPHWRPGYTSYRAGYAWPRSYVYYGAGYPYYNYGYYSTPVYSSSSYDSDYIDDRSSNAVGGAILGGIAGAIIGNNSGNHNGLQGAAIGAGAGLLLGAIADSHSPQRRVVVVPAQNEQVAVPNSPAPAVSASNTSPQNVTIINNYYGSSSMSAANGLYGR
jgi:outer membrane lipoprotein SlyB